MCDRKLGFFGIMTPYFAIWVNKYKGLRLFDFWLDRNVLFSLHLADSDAREFQKTKGSVIVFISS